MERARPRREKAVSVSYCEDGEDFLEKTESTKIKKTATIAQKSAKMPPPAATEERRSKVQRSGEEQTVVEIRQHAKGVENAYFQAYLLGGKRSDGLIEVQYKHLHESAFVESPVTEWLLPKDSDEVRPVPPGVPGGFYESICVGANIEVKFEEGWWPAVLRDNANPTFRVKATEFPALEKRSFTTMEVRPTWRWENGKWEDLTSGTVLQEGGSPSQMTHRSDSCSQANSEPTHETSTAAAVPESE